jgi:hypothetical protein
MTLGEIRSFNKYFCIRKYPNVAEKNVTSRLATFVIDNYINTDTMFAFCPKK